MTGQVHVQVPRYSGIVWVRLARSVIAVCVDNAVAVKEPPPLPIRASIKARTANTMQPVLAIYRMVSQLRST